MPPPRLSGLLLCILGGALAASLVSLILVFLLPGGADSVDETLPQTGPLGALSSDIVACVWVGLFAGLGAAFWLVAAGRPAPGRAGGAVLGLFALCVAYPILAWGAAAPIIPILGNIVTIAIALWATARCWPVSRLAAMLTGAVALWVSLATAGLVALMMGWPF